MMLRYCAMFLAVLLTATPVVAAESVVSGEVSVGLNVLRGDDNEGAKLQEYRDLSDGVTSGFNLFAGNNGFYLIMDADRIGRDDQSYQLKTGFFGKYRLSFFYDEMDHNFTQDARTVFLGAGTDALILGAGTAGINWAAANPNTSTWLPFDYVVERKSYGVKADLAAAAPFFLTVDLSETQKEGVYPWGLSSTTTTGGSYFTELPLPIDYTTTNLTATAGYSTKTLLAALDFSLSSFDNGNDLLSWVSPQGVTTATVITPVTMAPDNDMWQIGGKLVLRQLPLKSTLALRGSHSQLQSNPTLTAAGDFDGDITYTTASAALRSLPLDRLETDFSYRYVKKDNEARHFTYGGVDTHVFYYTKHNATAEAAYRLTSDNRVALGYDFTKIERSEEMRHDAEETKDHLFSAEWKNTGLDFMTAKLRYEHLVRKSDFNGYSAIGAVGGSDDIYLYSRPFDAANKDQDKFIVALDLAPCDHVELGMEYNYRSADYDKTVIGRTDERAQELIVDASVRLLGQASLYGYTAYEKSENTAFLRRYSGSATDPFVADTTGNYNWEVDLEDKTWSYGAKLEVPLFNERLKLSAAWDYQKNDGEADFSLMSTTPAALVDSSDYGDYTKKSIDLKAEYAFTDNLSMIAGYLYEKYNLDDIQYNDYTLTLRGGSATNTSYLTGAYADPDYDASTAYVTMTYKF